MPWRLALLNALAFFSSVIVYFVVLRATSFFPTGPDGQQFLNLWFLLSTALGILSFGLYRIPPMQRRQALLIVFLLWMFLHAAPHTRHPELWAGMGRAVELPCSGLGALVGTYCLTSLPVSTSLLAYTTLLVASSALLYHGLMLYATSLQQSEPLLSPAPAINLVAEIKAGAEEAGLPEDIPIQQDAPPISEKISQKQVEQNLQRYQNRYQLTNRETEVLGEILKDASIADMAAALFITQRTAKFHISNILRKTGAKNQRSLRRILEQDDQQD